MDNIKNVMLAVGLCLTFLSGQVKAEKCETPQKKNLEIAIDNSKNKYHLKLVDEVILDNKLQSTSRQSFLIENPDKLTEYDVNYILQYLTKNTQNRCRKYPLKSSIVFVFTSNETINGTNWVGRSLLDNVSGMPKIEVVKSLLPRTADNSSLADSNCEKISLSGKNSTKLSFSSDDSVKLPPVENRTILGTWSYMKVDSTDVTISIESYKGNFYEVKRYSDCSGGTTGGKLLKKTNSLFKRLNNNRNERFQITSNGNLSIIDVDGVIDTYMKHQGLWPLQ